MGYEGVECPDAFLVIFWPGDEGIGNNGGNSIVELLQKHNLRSTMV
jgi:hypothetical protein